MPHEFLHYLYIVAIVRQQCAVGVAECMPTHLDGNACFPCGWLQDPSPQAIRPHRHFAESLIAGKNPVLSGRVERDRPPGSKPLNHDLIERHRLLGNLRLVRAFSLPGDLVLDCFCGRGSTCAAALLTGRRYLGIELDSQYALTAQRRIERIHQRIEAKQSPPRLESPQGFHCLFAREGCAAVPPD